MPDGIDKIVDMIGSKAKGIDLSQIAIDMPGGTQPFTEDKISGRHRKATVLLAQKEQSQTWHVIKTMKKPAVHGLVFVWEKQLYVMDMAKVWYYDESANPIVMFDVSKVLPIKRIIQDDQEKLLITPNSPLKPDPNDKVDNGANIDSGFAYTMIVKRLLEQLARASAPEPKQFDFMMVLMIVVGLIGGLGMGLFLGPIVQNDVPAGTCPTGFACTPYQTTSVTTNGTITATVGGTTSC